MKHYVLAACIVLLLGLCGAAEVSLNGTVFINGTTFIAETDREFICATIDYGPANVCDHGYCWGNGATLFDMDLNNKILQNAIRAFSTVKIRMGGTLQYRMRFETPGDSEPCDPIMINSTELFGFSEGCLSMSRWDELHLFFKKTGAIVTFGLNVLYGRTVKSSSLVVGDWNSSNAEALLRYTLSKGYPIVAWELGNELCGVGIKTRLTPQQYASDLKTLHNLMNDVYNGSMMKPLIMAPSGFFEPNWFKDFMNLTTKDTIQIVSQHIYNLGPGADVNLSDKILNISILNDAEIPISGLQEILESSRSKPVAWISEAGGAYDSGRHLSTDAFVSGFWYLDQLGMAATHYTKTHCRQTLIGGGYGLLNSSTLRPNPDFYSALLWHRLMGGRVLSTRFSGTDRIRTYSHCSKNSTGLTLLLINLDGNTTGNLTVSVDDLSHESNESVWDREEYHLTAKGGDIHSQVMLLNGEALSIDSSGNIPELKPVTVSHSDPLTIAPYSYAFVRFPGIDIPACR